MSIPARLPTDAELEILAVLWAQGPSTVRQVHEQLGTSREVGYTTALKLLQIMFEKGLVERDESSRTHVYEAALDRDAMRSALAGDLTDRAFGGSASALIMGALSARPASREELAEIRRLLDELEGK
jgi:predicted transcriptional regulator